VKETKDAKDANEQRAREAEDKFVAREGKITELLTVIGERERVLLLTQVRVCVCV